MAQNPDKKFNQAFKAIRDFSFGVSYAGGEILSFSSNLLSGGPVIQGFLGSLQNLTNSVVKYSTAAFNQATEDEVNRVAAGGAISNSFDKKINFDSGLEIFDEVKNKLALMAASLPGSTNDYVTIFRSLSDDMATALNDSALSGSQLTEVFKNQVPNAVKNLVLQTKLYGQDIPVSSITKTYSKLLSTGVANAREIFVQRNPILRTAISKWERENGRKLPSLNIQERFQALNKIFADSISVEQMDALTNSFQAKVETLKSFLLDPNVGLFGFQREFKNIAGKNTTMFNSLANAIGPVLEGLSHFAQNLIKFGDPLQAADGFIQAQIMPFINKFSSNLNLFNAVFQTTSGTFEQRLDAGLKAAFNFDFKTFDYSGAIDNFFKSLVTGIENFGKSIVPGSEFEQSITSILNGLIATIGAIFKRAGNVASANPVETFQFVALTNPGVILQGVTALMATIGVLAPALKVIVSLLYTLLKPALVFLGALFKSLAIAAGVALAPFAAAIGVAVAILGFVVGIVVFSKQLTDLGTKLNSWGDVVGGFFGLIIKVFAEAMLAFGEAGVAFKLFWTKLTSGDILGAFVALIRGIVLTIGGVIGVISAAFLTVIASLVEIVKSIAKVIFDAGAGLGRILADIWTKATTGFGSFITDLGTKFSNLISGLNPINFLPKRPEQSLNASSGTSIGSSPVSNFFSSLIKTRPEPPPNAPSGTSIGKSPVSNFFSNLFGKVTENKEENSFEKGIEKVTGNAKGNSFGALVGKVTGNAEGNPFGNLLAAINTESQAMPSGSSIAIANTSEAIIPRDKALRMINNNSTNNPVSILINVTAQTQATAQDIASLVRKELMLAFEGV